MARKNELRAYSRFRIPVVIDAPSVSDFPLIPEDVSAGGFCIISPRQLEVGVVFTCSIQTGEEVFGSCVGEVVWVREGPAATPFWIMGISVKSLAGDRARLATLLQKLSERLGLAITPD